MSHIPQNKYSKMIDDLSPSKKKRRRRKDDMPKKHDPKKYI